MPETYKMSAEDEKELTETLAYSNYNKVMFFDVIRDFNAKIESLLKQKESLEASLMKKVSSSEAHLIAIFRKVKKNTVPEGKNLEDFKFNEATKSFEFIDKKEVKNEPKS